MGGVLVKHYRMVTIRVIDLITRIGFWGPVYHILIIRNPKNNIGKIVA